MWPKMLLELLPHLTRILPMADKFMNSRAAADKATADSINTIATQVREDLGTIRTDIDQVASAHAGLYRQLQDQSTQIATLSEDLRLTRIAAERAEAAARLVDPAVTIQTHASRRLTTLITMLIVLMVLSIALQLILHFTKAA